MATREVCIWKARRAVNRYTFIMLEHLLISLVFPLASFLSGEVGNIFDFQGKKEPLGEKTRARESGVVNARSVKQYAEFSRFTTWRLFQGWLDHLILTLFYDFLFSLHHTCFNFCRNHEPKPRTNLYFMFVLSKDQAKDDSGKFRTLKSFTQFKPPVFSFTFL